MELGYDIVQGTYVYCDGKYLPPFSFKKGTLEKNQTFIIDEKNAWYVLFMDPELRELTNSSGLPICSLLSNPPRRMRGQGSCP